MTKELTKVVTLKEAPNFGDIHTMDRQNWIVDAVEAQGRGNYKVTLKQWLNDLPPHHD